MKRFRWSILLGLALVVLSAAVYWLEYVFFNDARNTLFYLMQDVAFVPVQVLLVTLIVQRFLAERERRTMLKKLNMVIGAFYSEVGTRLLQVLSGFSPGIEQVRKALLVDGSWTAEQFAAVMRHFRAADLTLDSASQPLYELKELLADRMDFLVRLLENPNLLEHDTFSELLWAVFHLAEELAARPDVSRLSLADQHHLSGDMERAYRWLIYEWLTYMEHLAEDYPYLFSLAMRTNPFDPQARVELD